MDTSFLGNVPGNSDKQHDKHGKHEIVSKTNSLQPSGCNWTACAFIDVLIWLHFLVFVFASVCLTVVRFTLTKGTGVLKTNVLS